MKTLFLACVLAFFGLSANAQSKNKNAKIEMHVDGNCEMCKKRIEKAAFSVSGVKSASWDVSTEKLNLIVNEQKTDTETIQKAIAKAGHDTEGVKASDDDYSNLHGCCKYERTE